MNSFERLVQGIEEAPMTFLPALLKVIIEQCIKKKCFVPGGMEKFIMATEKEYREKK